MSVALFSPRYWVELLLLLVLGFVAIGLPIVPFGAAVGGKTFPDLLYCLIMAWAIRRPATAPILFVLLLGVIGDALLMRPLGLWALMLILGSEVLRYSEKSMRGINFLMEWIYAVVIFLILQLLQNFILYVAFAETYDFSKLLWYVLKTAIAYPFVVTILHWVIRVRSEEADEMSGILGLRR